MTYETYRSIFMGGAICSLVFLLLSVALFFLLQIPRVIGNLSGSAARKAIAGIRQQNEQTKDPVARTANLQRQRPAGRGATMEMGMKTEKIDTAVNLSTSPNETTVLYMPANETTVLSPQDAWQGTIQIIDEITLIHTNERIE